MVGEVVLLLALEHGAEAVVGPHFQLEALAAGGYLHAQSERDTVVKPVVGPPEAGVAVLGGDVVGQHAVADEEGGLRPEVAEEAHPFPPEEVHQQGHFHVGEAAAVRAVPLRPAALREVDLGLQGFAALGDVAHGQAAVVAQQNVLPHAGGELEHGGGGPVRGADVQLGRAEQEGLGGCPQERGQRGDEYEEAFSHVGGVVHGVDGQFTWLSPRYTCWLTKPAPVVARLKRNCDCMPSRYMSSSNAWSRSVPPVVSRRTK